MKKSKRNAALELKKEARASTKPPPLSKYAAKHRLVKDD